MAVITKTLLPAVLILIGVVQCQKEHCPVTARKSRHFVSTMDNMCYMFVGQEMYWDDARDYCWNLGGELISIENQDIMDHIKQMLASRRVRWRNKGIWIGARYFDDRGWRWTTGRKVTYGYWASGEPSLTFGISFEDCANMRRSEGWRWHDYPCHTAYYHYNFICQFRIEASPANVIHTPDSKAIGGLSSGQDGQTDHTASDDNGNTFILAIIIGAACLLILIIVLVFLIYRYIQKKKYARDVPAAHYANENYSEINTHHVSESPTLVHSRPRPASDVYLTPAEMNTLYEEVNKPANHGNNHLSHITCPLLINDNLQRESERQSAEGSSNELTTAVQGGSTAVETPPEVVSQPGPSTIPSIMETSTRSVNEYVEMSSGAVISHPQPDVIKTKKVSDMNSYCKPINNTEVPVYSNVESAQYENNAIYEELP